MNVLKIIFLLLFTIGASLARPREPTWGFAEFWGSFRCHIAETWCLSLTYVERDTLVDDVVYEMPNVCREGSRVLEHFLRTNVLHTESSVLLDNFSLGINMIHNCSVFGTTYEAYHDFEKQHFMKKCVGYKYGIDLRDLGSESSLDISSNFELPQKDTIWGKRPPVFPSDSCVWREKTTPSTPTTPTTTAPTTSTVTSLFDYLRRNCSETDMANYKNSVVIASSLDDSGLPEPPRSLVHTFRYRSINHSDSDSTMSSTTNTSKFSL
ncbi:hypothetical protein CRE_08370 [Caenorhabditis remanei]|uniref:Uncharacterized protein n=1 Tax=Caenorhabditis remanei TaxID=31234 RepID=E3MPD7_CAERE|nr:hypothetical protein CRE_08370 [Caenorhabditis remanei]